MALRVIRLGAPRVVGEGLRLGTVRRPPRGVLKSRYASDNWYDVWFPNLAPSLELMKQGHAAVTESELRSYRRKYKAEMSQPHARHDINMLAALSKRANLSVGCYCADESRCHRTVLRQLLAEAGAKLA